MMVKDVDVASPLREKHISLLAPIMDRETAEREKAVDMVVTTFFEDICRKCDGCLKALQRGHVTKHTLQLDFFGFQTYDTLQFVTTVVAAHVSATCQSSMHLDTVAHTLAAENYQRACTSLQSVVEHALTHPGTRTLTRLQNLVSFLRIVYELC